MILSYKLFIFITYNSLYLFSIGHKQEEGN